MVRSPWTSQRQGILQLVGAWPDQSSARHFYWGRQRGPAPRVRQADLALATAGQGE